MDVEFLYGVLGFFSRLEIMMLVFLNFFEKCFFLIIMYYGGGVVVEIGGLGDLVCGWWLRNFKKCEVDFVFIILDCGCGDLLRVCFCLLVWECWWGIRWMWFVLNGWWGVVWVCGGLVSCVGSFFFSFVFKF